MALFGAYKIHGDMQMGKKWTLENEPIIGYVLLSNIYALTFYLNQGMHIPYDQNVPHLKS